MEKDLLHGADKKAACATPILLTARGLVTAGGAFSDQWQQTLADIVSEDDCYPLATP